MLSINELKKLRKEITLNSLYISDYENTLFIKAKNVCDFFDSYIEYLQELNECNNNKKLDIIELISEYDNLYNLNNYYRLYSSECDPLFKNDYIALKSETANTATAIYSINTNYVKAARIFIDYHKNGDPYFIKYKQKYYLSEFVRVNF